MLSNMKRRVGIVAGIALLSALVPVLATSSATAAPATIPVAPSNLSTYSACPSSAGIPSAGMSDTTSTDVDCIAYYGITKGVTATTYEPAASIPRWQMALYLTRMADVTGHTLGSGADQGFTDIGGTSAEIQTAINQLAQLGVTTGTTATTFSPDDNVTREQMAMFMERLLGKTAVGPNGAGVSSTDALTLNISLSAADSYNYTDIDGGSVTFEGHNAIEELYNLGVQGDDKTVTTFRPSDAITRGEMATWITNALGHSNARPAGLNIEYSKKSGFANDPTVAITHRDANFDAIAGSSVTAWAWTTSTTLGDTEFYSADGTCNLKSTTDIVSGTLLKCQASTGDNTTDASGNINLGTGATTVGAKAENVYAWIGTSGTKYDNDLHSADLVTDSATSTANAGKVYLSCDVNSKAEAQDSANGLTDVALVHHGSTVNITAQMGTSYNGDLSFINIPQASAGSSDYVQFVHTIYQAGSDQVVVSATTTKVYQDANGTATYSVSSSDPNVNGASTDDNADDIYHKVVITEATPAAAITELVGNAKPCQMDATAMHFQFSDDATDYESQMALAQSSMHYKAAASALAPVSRSVTATVTDLFGDAKSGVTVNFHGSANATVKPFATTVSATNVLELTGNQTAAGLYPAVADNGTQRVCIASEGGTAAILAMFDQDTEYLLHVVALDTNTDLTFHAASGPTDTTGTLVTVANGQAPTADLKIAQAHPGFGCASRTTGYDGTASVAWNDSTTTSGVDLAGATASLYPGAAGNAQGTAAIVTATNGAPGYRWVAPSATALVVGQTMNTMSWIETTNDGGAPDGAGEMKGTPLVVDTANNTMIADISYYNGSAAVSTYTQYNWDDNDYFFINSNKGLAGAATSMAGFEGAYTASSATPGLENHRADAGSAIPGMGYTAGDLDGVSYQPLSGNVSAFMLGG